MYQIKLEKFQGPLDLLLQLIEQQKLEIAEVSLAQVTDQFISYIEKLENKDPEELADFLVIAARLLLYKSKAILPLLEDEEVVDDLEKQLKIYKEFFDAAKKIEIIIKQGDFTYSRPKPVMDLQIEFSPAQNITKNNLKEYFLIVLKRLDPLVKLPRQAIEKTVSLQQKVMHLKDLLNQKGKVNFNTLFKKAKSKTDVIVSFLAILELVKQQQLAVRQKKMFDEIYLEKV